ncbi:MAG: hypothetical protein ACREMD_05370 [Gemmatimonadota bacterium]
MEPKGGIAITVGLVLAFLSPGIAAGKGAESLAVVGIANNEEARSDGAVPLDGTVGEMRCDPIWDGPLFGILPGIGLAIVYGPTGEDR